MDVCRLLVTWALMVLAHGQQLNMRYVDWFAVRPKHMFWARTVFRLTGVSSEQCAMECLSMRGRCLSFDFHKRTGSCFGRANGEDTLRSNKRLRKNDNYDFYVANIDRVYAALRFYRAPQNNAGVHPPRTKLEHPPIRPDARIVPDMRFVTSRENNRYIARIRPTHTPIATASRRPVITTTTRRLMRATTTRRPVVSTTTIRPVITTTTRRPIRTTTTRRPIRTTTTMRPIRTTTTRRPVITTTTRSPVRTTTTKIPVRTI
uniref:Apple domain-containing protein n=1 Tax=Ciona savignyi TaxID=51511 RepID=H2ZPV7_CIOSA